MGLHAGKCEFNSINNLGIFNPRQNVVYQLQIESIPKDIIGAVSQDVIGYQRDAH